MANSKPIQGKQVIEDKFLKDAIDQTKKFNTELDTMEAGFREVITQQNKLLASSKGIVKDVKSFREVNTAIKKSVVARKGLKTIQEQRLVIEQKLKQARTNEADRLAETQALLTKQNKINKELANTKKGILGDYQRENAILKKLTRQYQDAAIKEGIFSKKAQELSKSVIAQKNVLKQVNNEIKTTSGVVGKAARSFTALLSSLGLVAGAAGALVLLKNVVGIFSNFQEANSNLAAILGVTTQETKDLTASQKELGATTAFTATQVAGLQTEYAKLGFSQEEILNATEVTLSLASATKTDLSDAARQTGAAIRAFKLDTSDAARVADVFAKAASSSALNMGFLDTALSNVAPVAASFGFTIEDTTALLGTLADAGFDASSAATATRNILLNLADTNGKLAKSLGGPVNNLEDLVDGLKTLDDTNIDLAKALSLTDKKSVAAFSRFIKGADSVKKLNTQLKDSKGFAGKTAVTQLDNLNGSVTLLSSAYEGFILNLEDGNGVIGKTLRLIVDVTAQIFNFLSGVQVADDKLTDYQKTVKTLAESTILFGKALVVVVSTFTAYKLATSLASIATRTYATVTGIAKVATAFLSGGLKNATVAMKGLNTAVRANPFGIFVTLITAVTTAFFLFKNGANEAAEAQKVFNEAQLEGARILDNTKTIESRAKIAKNLSQEQLKNEISNAKQELKAIEEKNTKIAASNEKLTAAQLVELKSLQESLAKGFDTYDELEAAQSRLTELLDLSEDSQLESEKITQRQLADQKEILQNAIRIFENEIGSRNKIDKQTLTGLKQRITLEKILQDVIEARLKTIKEEGEFAKIAAELRQKALADIQKSTLESAAKSQREGERILNATLAREEKIFRKRQEMLEKRLNFSKEFEQALTDEVSKQSAKRNKLLSAEVKEKEASVQEQLALAKNGLDNSLVAEKEALAQARLTAKEEKERQQRVQEGIQLASAFYESYIARLQGGEDTNSASVGAFSDTLKAKGLAKAFTSLAGFYHGTEYVDENSHTKVHNGQDGMLARLHKGERVVPEYENKYLSGISNPDLVSMAIDAKKGSSSVQIAELKTAPIEQKLDQLIKAVIDSKPDSWDVDKLANLVKTEVRNGMKTRVTYQKNL